jgi:hypothetical protein
LFQLTCLTLLPRVGDAIAMAGLAGFPQPEPREHIDLQVEMDVADLLHNMAGPGKGNDARTHSGIEEGNSGHVLPWLRQLHGHRVSRG